MDLNRRSFFRAGLSPVAAAAAASRKRLGIGTAAYGQRASSDRSAPPTERFTATLRFLEHCRGLGAGGIQAPLASLEPDYSAKVREAADRHGMYVEVSARLPRTEADVEGFARTLQAAREAGASVIRTVMLSGRRYETFQTLEGWQEFRRQSWRSLTLAEPVARKRGLRLALENHKDWRIPEMLRILERISSEAVGVTLDTGNNLSLLEAPMETVRALAPHALAVHLKDMAVEAYRDGFLLAEVPFGQGRLDLKEIVAEIRSQRPATRFTLEMITRDPLKIPCLLPSYWTTMRDGSARSMANLLRAAQERTEPLPRVAQLPYAERVRIEEANNRACLEYARTHLDL